MLRSHGGGGSAAVLLIAGAALAAQALGAGVLAHRWGSSGRRIWPNDEISTYERRLAGLRPFLPQTDPVGYLEDGSWPHGPQTYLLTQYALSPTVVLRNTVPGLVIANFQTAAALPDSLRASGLQEFRRFPNGLRLLRHEGAVR